MNRQSVPSFAERHANNAHDESVPYEIEVSSGSFLYDYGGLDEDTEKLLKRMVVDIRRRQRNALQDMIAVGNQLLAAKVLLPHGGFERWAQAEFDLSQGSVTEFRLIASRFADKPNILKALTPTTARLLAGPTTPDDVIEAVVELSVEQGRPLFVREVKLVKQTLMAKEIEASALVEEIEVELEAGYYAVVLEERLWRRIRDAMRKGRLNGFLMEDENDRVAEAISVALTTEVEGPHNVNPTAQALTFAAWLDLIPSSDDLADLLDLLRVVQVKLKITGSFVELQRGGMQLMAALNQMVSQIAKRMS